ncbi:zinc finger protein CONSTANS-LIKE 5 [Malania oleifera]|uniref:zinc finger protein CONSTANS-LIKE 5 n=1 Tax=Malania oleifera TaxID=397392 RepID=UPI0025ADC3F4|nr:zinc finger protein CONSTANS-LIKE 5 [Malania oleifera]
MGIEEDSGKIFPSGWVTAKPCDSCESAAALVFCRVDSAFLCAGCDERLHKTTSGHERVWMCEVCEQAPAAVTCKADAAALCVACDRDIHSANPLARRHDRIPVVPFYVSATSVLKSSPVAGASALVPKDAGIDDDGDHSFTIEEAEEAEAASWILPNPNTSNQKFAEDLKPGELFFGDVDPFLDFESGASMNGRFQQHNSGGSDSVVPIKNKALGPSLINHRASENCFDVDFCRSKLSSYSSLSQSVSSDVGVVPDGNSASEVSYPHGKQISGGVDPSGSTASNQASQSCGSSDREARVLRYREKRKNRKFEKTIRYASRKAYAETRPRIKGRFAKRTEIEAEVDRIYSSASAAFMADSGYGVVPSF